MRRDVLESGSLLLERDETALYLMKRVREIPSQVYSNL